ncbi:hypothetical protein [Paludifilum halophilum]|uniref:Uncharacterized protein n=1 Tax=Paludifilum halophilum TaxID=1642702 RepID=A0A235B6A0_9BACL|nr:hypothetical protein [Paludifilum halophilum]OYD07823.1 hypothetical protein CHM34_10225 [Paludifilum halophilum]
MRLQEALFNWLQIKVVWEKRPKDRSAEETTRFFEEILVKDHHVEDIRVSKAEEAYTVFYRHDGEEHTQRYDREQVDQLLVSIESEPKYNQSFDDGPETD